ncbi:adenylate/guanylate cyclase domain-containing protein [Oscillatoria sp. FACHB-1406]|uniref:CHASE2 domain-containing protein n=1 Tax=Oscillatoria sp. FACHB-1406 TaxID=2692846 RepID=UPI001686BE08|nr:adenylate/guanylate cyclase domain-containing protein [Oscillatoria sp. FACHB-1406]MBD2577392.1 adenylate/guanylate cyclase domain-containing protein [Oscillatoria sp. FACHB-1406]
MWAKLKKFLWEWRGVWIAGPTSATLILLLRFVGGLQMPELLVLDEYMRHRPTVPADKRIAIVGINEEDVKQIGQAIVPDRVYAEAIDKLKAQQPRAIGLDIYRDLPVPPGHEELVKVFESTPNLVGIEKVVGDSGKEMVAPPPVLKAKGQVGANDLIIDSDKRIRRGFMYLESAKGETVFSFPLHLALQYLDRDGISPRNVEGSDDTWWLGKTLFTQFKSNHGGYIRADAGGFQTIIDYRGGSGYFETVPLSDILNNRVPKDWARDRVILIGVVGESFNDSYFTPYSGSLLRSPKPVAGVEIHAALVSQILNAAIDGRPLFRSWSEPVENAWIVLWAVGGAILAWKWRKTTKRWVFMLTRAIAPSIAIGVLMGGTYIAYLYGWWLPVVPPLLAFAGSTLAITGYMAYTASKIRHTFGRYLTDAVVANLLESPEGLKLGGKRQCITILTSDLRGFTALSERLPPEEVVTILNLYLKAMLATIQEHEGTIDKFLGDGILVHFGTPETRPDDAQRAVACAIAMQLAIEEVNRTLTEMNLPLLEMGIGIHTGECVVGNIGSELHAEYTVIGNHVNLAFRIETYSTGNQILISQDTLAAIGAENLRIDGEKQVKPKGVKDNISLYEIGGIGDRYNLYLPKNEEQFIRLRWELPVLYFVLEGKQVSDTIFKGNIVSISTKGVEIRIEKGNTDSMPPPLSNLKINFLKLGDRFGISEDVYAKVLDRTASRRTFYIHFTYKPPTIAAALVSVLTDALQQSE